MEILLHEIISAEKNHFLLDVWKDVFQHGNALTQKFNVGGGEILFRGFLSADKTECASNIRENDPLYYKAEYNAETNIFKEDALVLHVKPDEGSYLALGSVRLRKVTIKNATPEKIKARFEVLLNDLVLPNLERLTQSNAVIKSHYDKFADMPVPATNDYPSI